jgi:hypothetical protein
MEVLYAICCGLDVHKASVIACLRSPGVGAQRHPEVCRLASIRSTPTEAPSRDVQRQLDRLLTSDEKRHSVTNRRRSGTRRP